MSEPVGRAERARPALSGLLLAGGPSRRMGRDKASIEWHGRTLASRAAGVLEAVCDDVLVAAGERRLPDVAHRHVADHERGGGALAGLLGGLAAARHPLVAVLAVDLVYASPAVLRLLADRWNGEAAVVPVVHGLAQPLHAVWSAAALPALLERFERGERGLLDALAALGARVVGPDEWSTADPSGRFCVNVNRPGDLPPET